MIDTPTRSTAAHTPRLRLAALGLCALLPALGTSIANVALPQLAQALGASFQQLQWVLLAYLLASTTLVVSVGRLGDLTGPRRLLLGGIALFALASGLCAAAPGLAGLFAARALQGLGAAVMMVLGLALVTASVPKARSGQAMGLLATLSALGTALGPALGGLLLARLGWPALFWLQVPLALLALGLVWRYLPADAPRVAGARQARFDGLGALLLALTLGAYALALTLGRGRFGALNLALLLLAALGLGVFVWVEGRVAAPLLRLATLREAGLSRRLLAIALVATVLMTSLVVGPFHLAHGLGLGAAQLGLVMSLGPASVVLAGVPAGRAVDRLGAARVGTLGLFGMLLGCGALALAPLTLVGYAGPLVLLTSSYALFQAATQSAVMAERAAQERGVVAGLLSLARNLGLISGAALMGAVFALALPALGLLQASPAEVGLAMQRTFAVAAGLLLLALALVWRVSGPGRA